VCIGGAAFFEMHERLELRVNEDFAYRIFSPSEGVRLGDRVRKITISPSDERVGAILAFQSELQSHGQALYFGWNRRRFYLPDELASATFFVVNNPPSHRFSGDESGTAYDESIACPICGAGREQIGPLRLRLAQLPRVKDIVHASTSEWIVSARFVEALRAAGETGVRFEPIDFRRGRKGANPTWYQLLPSERLARIASRTQLGVGPFPAPARDAEYVCPLGDTLGLNRLSELHFSLEEESAPDVTLTREYIGARRGLFTPRRELVLTRKARDGLIAADIRGLDTEVAHLVSTDAA